MPLVLTLRCVSYTCLRTRSYIEEGFIWHIFTHIFLALKECHRHREGNVVRPILHRDIKPGNIFLDSNVRARAITYPFFNPMALLTAWVVVCVCVCV